MERLSREYGKIIYAHRSEQEMNMDELCDKLLETPFLPKRPSKTTISKIERGLSYPSPKIALALCVVFQEGRVLIEHPSADTHIYNWYELFNHYKKMLSSEQSEVLEEALTEICTYHDIPYVLEVKILLIRIDRIIGKLTIDRNAVWLSWDRLETARKGMEYISAPREDKAKLELLYGIYHHQRNQVEEARRYYASAQQMVHLIYGDEAIQKCWWYGNLIVHKTVLNFQLGDNDVTRPGYKELSFMRKNVKSFYDPNIYAYLFLEISRIAFLMGYPHYRVVRLTNLAARFAEIATRTKKMPYKERIKFLFHQASVFSYYNFSDQFADTLHQIERISTLLNDYSMYHRLLAEKTVATGGGYEEVSWYIQASRTFQDKLFFVSSVEDVVARAYLNDGNLPLAKQWFEQYIEKMHEYGDPLSVQAALLRVENWFRQKGYHATCVEEDGAYQIVKLQWDLVEST